MMTDALQKLGAARSIVIDEANVILAGNGIRDAAATVGIDKVRIVEADGKTLIAVRRRGLTETEKRDLAIADNRTAELAEWNVQQFEADVRAGLTFEPWFSAEELDALVGPVRDLDLAAQVAESAVKGLRLAVFTVTPEQYDRLWATLDVLKVEHGDGASPSAEGNAMIWAVDHASART
jgi:hypothetical protein